MIKFLQLEFRLASHLCLKACMNVICVFALYNFLSSPHDFNGVSRFALCIFLKEISLQHVDMLSELSLLYFSLLCLVVDRLLDATSSSDIYRHVRSCVSRVQHSFSSSCFA